MANGNGSRIQSPYGLYQFRVMPFGLKNAIATFQRLMDMVLGELKGCICFVYLDDIIIYSNSWQQHFMDVQAVMDKLRQAGLTVNVKKSKFLQTSLTVLGHVVSSDVVQVDPDKTQAVQSFPVPTNRKSLERFLRMAGWCHQLMPNFSQIAEPMNALKRGPETFHQDPLVGHLGRYKTY